MPASDARMPASGRVSQDESDDKALHGMPANSSGKEAEQDIWAKIELARSLWERHGEALKGDPLIHEAAERFNRAIDATWDMMKRLEVVKCCSRCATTKPGGGCCGAAIENWYDHYIILMNLLLGVELPERRLDPDGCIFLGPAGCTLRARYHFCINYLCSDIKDFLSDREVTELMAQNGNEIYHGWLLETLIRERIG